MRITLLFKAGAAEQVFAALRALELAPSYAERSPNSAECTLVYDRDLTTQELATIKDAVGESVVKFQQKGIEAYDLDKLRNMTVEQINTYIDIKVTDLATAKGALKVLAKLIRYLIKKLEETT